MVLQCRGEDSGVIDMCRVQEQIGRLVIESKFLLLTARQANKSRDKVLEQEIATLFGKPAGTKDGGLVPPKNHLTQARILASFKRGESVVGCCKLLDARILCSCWSLFL